MRTDWLEMERRLRKAIREAGEICTTEDRLRDLVTRLDEIIACETHRGNEITPGALSGERYQAIADDVWR